MEFPMDEIGVYNFNDFVLPSPSPLDDEEIPWPSNDLEVYLQENGYRRLTPKPPAYHRESTRHQINHMKSPVSKGTRSLLSSRERPKVYCCSPQAGSDNLSDTSQEIQPGLQQNHIRSEHNILNEPKLVNGRPLQSSERYNCSLDTTGKGSWSERCDNEEDKDTYPASSEDQNFSENSRRKIEVLSKPVDEVLIHDTGNFDLKSSSSTSTESICGKRVIGQEFDFQQDPTPSNNISVHPASSTGKMSSTIYNNIVQQNPYHSSVDIGSQIIEDEHVCETNRSNDLYTYNHTKDTVNHRVWKSSDDSEDLHLIGRFESDEDATSHNSYHVAQNKENKYKPVESKDKFAQMSNVDKRTLAMFHHKDSKTEECRAKICEELQIPVVQDIMSGKQKPASNVSRIPVVKRHGGKINNQLQIPVVQDIMSGEQKPASNVSRIPVVKRHGGKINNQKPKKESETKKETGTAALRKEYDERQRAEIKRRRAKRSTTTVKTEVTKGKKTSEVSTNTKLTKIKKQSPGYSTEGRLGTCTDACKRLPVRAESEENRLCSEKEDVEYQKENISYEYEDDFESDNDIKSSISDAKQATIRSNTILSSSNTKTQERVVGKNKSHAKKSHRSKVSPESKELISSKESSLTLPKIVGVESTDRLYKQLRGTTETTPHTQRKKELCLPAIERNNSVIAKNPRRTSSKEINHTTEAQGMLAKDKSLGGFNRRSEYQDQSAHGGMGYSRCKSGVRRKSSAKSDRNILENRAKAPPFDTQKEEEVYVRFPKL